MSVPTIYPYRRSLSYAIRDRIITAGVPSINAGLTQVFGASAPQFTDASLTIGNLENCNEPTICIIKGASYDDELAAGQYYAEFNTQIHVKTPAVGDNSPEAFEAFSDVLEDNLRDLLNSQKSRVLIPMDGNGNPNLPQVIPVNGQYQSFYRCHIVGVSPASLVVQADTKTRVRGLILAHRARLNYAIGRAEPVGG